MIIYISLNILAHTGACCGTVSFRVDPVEREVESMALLLSMVPVNEHNIAAAVHQPADRE